MLAYLSIVSIASNTPFNDEEFNVDISFIGHCLPSCLPPHSLSIIMDTASVVSSGAIDLQHMLALVVLGEGLDVEAVTQLS